MSKKDRLLELIDKVSNGSKTAFANKLGISPQGLSSWISRDTYDIELIYSKCENISAAWLISGEGDMFASSESLDEKSIRVKLGNLFNKVSGDTPMDSQKRKDIFRRLQLVAANEGEPIKEDFITTQAQNVASYETILKWIAAILKNKEDKYSFDWIFTGEGQMLKNTNELLPRKIPLINYDSVSGFEYNILDIPIEHFYIINEFSNADFLLRINGDSMYPKYSNGSLVACKKVEEITFWQWGKIYAICTKNQGVLIKRVREYEGNPAFITLVSENSEFTSFEIHEDEIVDVALVLGAIILE